MAALIQTASSPTGSIGSLGRCRKLSLGADGNAGWVYRAALGTTPEGIMRGLGCLNTCCMETSAKCVGAAG